MKKFCCILLGITALTFWGSNAMADDDPVLCYVEINYNGKDFGGHDDGVTKEAAFNDAKEEACERACRKFDDACEQTCMETAVVNSHECKENPKADKTKPKGGYDCRAAIRYNGMEFHAMNDDHHLDKAAREAVEEACEDACRGQEKNKKCEHKCRVNAQVIGTECFDLNNRIVLSEGTLPPRPAGYHPNAEPMRPLIAAEPAPPQDKKVAKEDKKAEKDIKKAAKEEKKAMKDIKEAAKEDKKALKDIKEAVKEEKKALKDIKKAAKEEKKALKDIKKAAKEEKKAMKDIKKAAKDEKKAMKDIKKADK